MTRSPGKFDDPKCHGFLNRAYCKFSLFYRSFYGSLLSRQSGAALSLQFPLARAGCKDSTVLRAAEKANGLVTEDDMANIVNDHMPSKNNFMWVLPHERRTNGNMVLYAQNIAWDEKFYSDKKRRQVR